MCVCLFLFYSCCFLFFGPPSKKKKKKKKNLHTVHLSDLSILVQWFTYPIITTLKIFNWWHLLPLISLMRHMSNTCTNNMLFKNFHFITYSSRVMKKNFNVSLLTVCTFPILIEVNIRLLLSIFKDQNLKFCSIHWIIFQQPNCVRAKVTNWHNQTHIFYYLSFTEKKQTKQIQKPHTYLNVLFCFVFCLFFYL